jgi:hypothetical protein
MDCRVRAGIFETISGQVLHATVRAKADKMGTLDNHLPGLTARFLVLELTFKYIVVEACCRLLIS